MQNSGHNYSSSILFNSHLFIINGAPLKFYLDGYSPTEFNDIVKIIEAYGGKLTKPDGPDTFVFSEPGRPVDAGEYDLYDIEYFYDSIVALQPQNLIKYKLQVFTKPQMRNQMSEDETSRLKIEVENIEDSQESMDYHLQTSTDEESSSCVDDYQSSELENKGEKTQNSDKMGKLDSDGKNNDFYEENRDDRLFSSTELHNESSDNQNSCAAARNKVFRPLRDCFVKVECLTEDEIKVASTHAGIHDQDDEAEAERWESPSEDDGDACDDSSVEVNESLSSLRRSLTARVENISGDRKSIGPGAESGGEKSLEGNLIHETSVESRGGKTKSRRKSRLPWTEEEHQVMIKYLIDNDAIHRAKSNKVWRECLTQCKDLLHHSRTPEGLRTRWRNHIRPVYAKYTDDPEILEKFKKVEKTTRRESAKHTVYLGHWTHEENQAVVQYLIDKDAIWQGGSERFWTENYEGIEPSLTAKRTPNAIRTHFYSKLRLDYAKYTDDPEALRKFKEFEPLERSKILN